MKKFSAYLFILVLISNNAWPAVLGAPVNISDTAGTTLTSTGSALDVNLKSGAIPAGTALIGKVGIDQTTPGTTNAASISHIGSATVLTGNGATGTGSLRVTIANDQTAFPVTTSPAFNTRADTFTSTTSGTTVDAHLAPVKYFTISAKATGAVTSWTIVLEGSLDNTNFTTLLTHTNVTPGDGSLITTGTSAIPMLYFRARCSAITLGGGTNVIATILGM